MENIVNESAYICVQNNRKVINDEDIMLSFEKHIK